MPYIWFDPSVTGWSSLDQFEYFLSRALGEAGLEGERVQSYPKDALVIVVKAKPMVSIPDVSGMSPRQRGKQKSMKSHIQSLMPKEPKREKGVR